MGNFISDALKIKIDKTPGSLERVLELYDELPIMLIKNLDVNSGIVNCLTGHYVDHSDKVLLMKLENGSIIPIPNMRQKINFEISGLAIYRIQFPIVNASAQTIHKVQDPTLNRCHASIDNTLFSDGQAYVALSRVKNSKDLHLKKLLKNQLKSIKKY